MDKLIYLEPNSQGAIAVTEAGNYYFMLPERDTTGTTEFIVEPSWLLFLEKLVKIARNHNEHGILPDTDLGGVHPTNPRKRMSAEDYK